eukprot:3693419-Rhodomonas_salina.1
MPWTKSKVERQHVASTTSRPPDISALGFAAQVELGYVAFRRCSASDEPRNAQQVQAQSNTPNEALIIRRVQDKNGLG